MRIQKISTDKVVVQLTDTDLEHFDLDFEKSIPQAADLHKLLFEVMEIVKNETGFDAYRGGQVVVEATPFENGLSLLITKIRTEKKSMSYEDFSKIKRVRVKEKRAVSHDELRDMAKKLGIIKDSKNSKNELVSYIFDNFENLESAVCAVPDLDFSDMVLCRNDKKYALIGKRNAEIKEFNVLSEYTARISGKDIVANRIKEGWQLIAENDELVRMTNEIRKM